MYNEKGIKKANSIILIIVMMLSTWFGTARCMDLQAAAAKPTLNQSSLHLLIGKTTTLRLKKKVAGAKIGWKSKNKKIATVAKNGKVKGVNKGSTKVTASVSIGKKRYSLKCTVKVVQKAKDIRITDENGTVTDKVQIKVGEKLSLGTSITPKASNDFVSSWKSKNNKVAKVNNKGLVTAVSPGVATITATAFGKKNDSVTITVVGGNAVATPTVAPSQNVTSTPKPVSTPTPTPTGMTTTGLKWAYRDYFSIGTAVSLWQLRTSSMLKHINEQYNSVTMENEMKPNYLLGWTPNLVERSQAEFTIPEGYKETVIPKLDFSTVDAAMKIAKDNGLIMRGHTLVWHSQTPDWFFREGYSTSTSAKLVTKEVMNARMEYYIQQVMLHLQTKYPGVIYAWDVVNEIFTDRGGLRAAGSNVESGQSLWSSIYGSDEFAVKAFEYAAKYRESGVKLFYNDYNEYITRKTTAIVNFAKKVYAKGHIDGIGMQTHLDCEFPSVSTISTAMDSFASIAPNFEIQLTEVDVTINRNSTGVYTLSDQTKYYKSLMDMVVAKKKSGVNITNVTFWGLYDEVSWRKEYKPLLFNYSASKGFVKKDSYTSVLGAVK